ncbi:MAG: 4'-phosphopantetheinyl transferase family protein [Syntrophales bacterium]
MAELAEEDVHLWFAFPDEWEGPGLDAALRDVLDAGEIARSERIRFPAQRRLFLASRLLLRTVLARYGATAPGAWRFVADEHGKPRVAPGAGSAPAFNLSHTAGVAVVAVTARGDVGVDVENRGRRVQARRLSERFFSPAEAAELAGLPAAELQERFIRTWTLKEAYVKGLGLGFSRPLDSFAFSLTGGRPYRIGFAAAPPPADPREWRFALIEPRPRLVAALAVACDRPAAVTVRCFRMALPDGMAPLAAELVGRSPGILLPAAGDGR